MRVLPVELTSFSAAVNGGSVVLSWQTGTEVDNYGFEVERASTTLSMTKNVIPSGDEGWETIGFVEGYGNSNSPKKYSFIDETPKSGTVQYRLKQIDTDGSFEYSDIVEVELESNLPTEYSLEQNYPNPFNPSTTIKFDLPKQQKVSLKIYNILGSEVVTLVNEEKEAGRYALQWNGRNSFGGRIASGLYIYRIKTPEFTSTKKMLMLK